MSGLRDYGAERFNEDLDAAFAACHRSSQYTMDPNRPYDGQSHTDDGERGKTRVEGLTMRDVRDCILKGFLLASGDEELNRRADSGAWSINDVYKVSGDIDFIAVSQNAMCEVERMMGIFPNVPPLEEA